MKNLSFLGKFIFFINTILAFLLLFTYVIKYIDPETLPQIAILSLAYPALLLINIIFVIIWVVKLKIQFLLSTICIIVGLTNFHNFFSLEGKEIIKQSDIKVLSFNVRRYNQFNWIESPNIKQDICDFVNKQRADIVCIQEHLNTKDVNFNLPKVFEHKKSGLAIYSKFPVKKIGNPIFNTNGNNVIYVDLNIQGETVRVYNVHLQSFRLDTKKEYYGDTNNEALFNTFKSVFKKQAEQIKTLKQHIEHFQHKTIVMGDFNNTAFSWNYNEIMENRKDAFVEAGINFGKSFKYYFPFRIDFILPDNTMEVGKFTTFSENLSDHYPIMARINLKK